MSENEHTVVIPKWPLRTESTPQAKLPEGTKHDAGKPPFDLVSPDWIDATARVLDFGAKKYEPNNWAKGIKYGRVFAALLRHLWAWWRGRELDEETGLPHLWHASCCLMFLVHYEYNKEEYREYDDRYWK